jgi:hypothetical protein
MLSSNTTNPPLRSMLITLQMMRHFIRTGFGDSKECFSADLLRLFHSIGQGNGAGPPTWAAVCTPIIEMMRAAGFGFQHWSAISRSVLEFVGYAFVDDTDLVHTSRDPNATGAQIALEMQDVIDHWEAGLRCTGGALVPSKSFWYLIDFWFNGSKWIYSLAEDVPAELSVLGKDGITRRPLKRYEPDIANETLGTWICPRR